MSVVYKTKTIINPETKNKQTTQGTTRVLTIKKKKVTLGFTRYYIKHERKTYTIINPKLTQTLKTLISKTFIASNKSSGFNKNTKERGFKRSVSKTLTRKKKTYILQC